MCATCRALARNALTPQGQRLSLRVNQKRERDPTRTQTLRAEYVSQMIQRFTALERVIRKSIVDNDALGIQGNATNQGKKLTPLPRKAFADRTDPARVKGFNRWMQSQVDRGILERVPANVGRGTEPWQAGFIRRATAGGIKAGNRDTVALIGGDVKRLSSKAIKGMLSQGAPLERVKLAYAQSFEALEGVTKVMSNQIGRALAEGLAKGQSTTEIAAAINDRVDKVGLSRAKTIARTEIVEAHNKGVLLENRRASVIIDEEVMSEWNTTLDGRARAAHLERHEQVFREADALALIGEPNCVVGSTAVQAPCGIERVFERAYDGPIVMLRTASGKDLSCTPNHPILTERGAVPAHSLNKGDNVLGSPFARGGASAQDEKDLVIAPIEELARAWREEAHRVSRRVRPDHFHGDGEGSKVCVVYSDWELMRKRDAARAQQIGGSLFARPYPGLEPFADSSLAQRLLRILLSASRFMRRGDLLCALRGGHLRPLQKLRLVSAPHSHPMPLEDAINRAAFDGEPICERLARLASRVGITDSRMVNGVDGTEAHLGPTRGSDAPRDGLLGDSEVLSKLSDWPQFGEMFADEIVHVDRVAFSGHVYNLQSVDGLYISNGLLSKNCRCALTPYVESIQGEQEPGTADEFLPDEG